MNWLWGFLVGVVGAGVAWWWFRPAPAPRLEGEISNWVIPDSWSVGSGTYEGKAIISRFNNGLRGVAGNPAFPAQMGIAVRFNKPREDGFPDSSEMDQLNEVEDEIGRRFCQGNESFFAGVITTAGMREFVLYTSNESAAIEKGKKLAAEITHHDIQFVLNRDPEWNVYKSLAGK